MLRFETQLVNESRLVDAVMGRGESLETGLGARLGGSVVNPSRSSPLSLTSVPGWAVLLALLADATLVRRLESDVLYELNRCCCWCSGSSIYASAVGGWYVLEGGAKPLPSLLSISPSNAGTLLIRRNKEKCRVEFPTKLTGARKRRDRGRSTSRKDKKKKRD